MPSRFVCFLAVPLSLLLVSPPSLANSQIDIDGAQQASHQRSLVERMTRSYAWRWLDANDDKARRQYAQAASEFSAQLIKLRRATASDAELQENYALLAQQWDDYQTLIASQPKAQDGRALLEASEDMTWIAQKGTQLLEAKLGPAQKPVQLAEDIGALSQRLAKIYLMRSAGLTLPFLHKDLASARTEFDAASRQLRAYPGNTPSMQSQLQLLDTQWLFFQQAIDELAKQNLDRQLQRNVFTTSDRIYEVATELAQRYRAQMH
ncbi:hypothetical protein [Chitinimonas taiwanensis]|uniref:Type IV pili methyl-accepting chemotaxis transducer N-term n=1 Tax=Chitinimonas taiwanensis DSM 18899 TaxID=1121279 RepID=A0A1K2HQZ2_9NEIS|nr:hypothetical protein [Chitinimonas taiwanensis]SFZ79125.1 hypothetical protein SAMN02745887_03381 [Chitinimonas taiwanensis DSM 18899]